MDIHPVWPPESPDIHPVSVTGTIMDRYSHTTQMIHLHSALGPVIVKIIVVAYGDHYFG